MKPYELRIELNDVIVQELIWHAIEPGAITMTRALNEAIEQQQAQLGPPPEGARVSGVSVVSEQGRMYAEIAYTAG